MAARATEETVAVPENVWRGKPETRKAAVAMRVGCRSEWGRMKKGLERHL